MRAFLCFSYCEHLGLNEKNEKSENFVSFARAIEFPACAQL